MPTPAWRISAVVRAVSATRGAAILIIGVVTGSIITVQAPAQPRYGAIGELYAEVCSACHGETLEGTALGSALVGADLRRGDSSEAVQASIRTGNPEMQMPAFGDVLDAQQIQSLAIFVLEQRRGYTYEHYGVRGEVEVPDAELQSQHHSFVIESFVENLAPLPYAITPMPDGRLLLSEKKRGLSFISPNGEQSPVVRDTPRVYDDSEMSSDARALDRGLGWMQDVALDPDYESNGWVYIYYGDRCDSCNDISRARDVPVSMSRVMRGRIAGGQWQDEELIWASPYEHYTPGTDLSLGGRLALDGQGHVYFSVGAKNGFYDIGIQALDRPYGKIHRMRTDGAVPADNPFVKVPGVMESIWTLGHRVPQGLEYDTVTGELWSTEHGARGGDELNLIEGGANYGWPLVTSGVHYDGTSIVDLFDVEFDEREMRAPITDLIPSPAISSFVVYRGARFPAWTGNIIAGSLKANALLRFALDEGRVLEQELLVDGVGRIRDVAVDADGEILMLIENAAGGRILRIR